VKVVDFVSVSDWFAIDDAAAERRVEILFLFAIDILKATSLPMSGRNRGRIVSNPLSEEGVNARTTTPTLQIEETKSVTRSNEVKFFILVTKLRTCAIPAKNYEVIVIPSRFSGPLFYESGQFVPHRLILEKERVTHLSWLQSVFE